MKYKIVELTETDLTYFDCEIVAVLESGKHDVFGSRNIAGPDFYKTERYIVALIKDKEHEGV